MPEKFTVRVLFFGRLADQVSEPEFEYTISPGANIADLYAEICEKNPSLPSRDKDPTLKTAQNQSLAGWSSLLTAEDEIAFLPPVTGG